jgi:hypothetical protein
MPHPVIPKPVMIVQCRVNTVQSKFENILYYEPPSGITTVSQMQAIANAVFATFAPKYANVMNNSSYFQQVLCTYNSGSVELQGFSTTGPTQGTLGGSPVGDQNSVVLRKVTNMPGRTNAGRWFIGAMDSGSFSSTQPNEVDTTIALVYETLVAAMVADQTWDSLLFHARHWSRKTNTLEVIAAGAVSSRIATSRARRRQSFDFAY